MKTLYIKLNESKGEIRGRIDFPADSTFVLECLAEVVRHFSKNCQVPALEVLNDLKGLL